VKGDLHCHTKLSDGSEGIEDVIALAKRIGLDFISLTDHDTMASFSRSKILAERYGINVIPGVEFSGYDEVRNRKVHILCYLPLKPDRLEGLCIRANESRKKAGNEMAKLVMKKYPITPESITKYSSSSNCIYKQHIMRALFDAGYTTSIYGDLFYELFNRKTGSCLVSYRYPDVYEVLGAIHEAGGIAVLAHPTVYQSADLMHELVEKNLLDGIEVYHPRNSEEDSKEALALAETHGLLVTGGSDFHGMYSSTDQSYLGSRCVHKDALDQLFKISAKYKETTK
jgi:predicted metal-dependent phosphoesterase TrpH